MMLSELRIQIGAPVWCRGGLTGRSVWVRGEVQDVSLNARGPTSVDVRIVQPDGFDEDGDSFDADNVHTLYSVPVEDVRTVYE